MLDDLQLFAMTRKTLDWAARRQSVLSENIANANTPGYAAKDVTPLTFRETLLSQASAVRPQTATHVSHVQMAIEQPIETNIIEDRRPQETKPDGNTVQIEDQMERVGQVKHSYELALNLFRKNMGMIKTVVGGQS